MIMPVCGRKGRKMELIVPFDSQSESPLYEQIYQYIKNEIRQGKLEAGSRLPSLHPYTGQEPEAEPQYHPDGL